MGRSWGRGVAWMALVAAGLAGGSVAAQPHAASPDTRQRVVLAPAVRDTVLGEMRLMLESVNAALRGLAAGDLALVEKSARAAGMAVATELDPRIMRELPPAFRELGMQTHRAFDDLADRLKAGGGRDEAIRGLAAITGNCVACHAVWRLDEAR